MTASQQPDAEHAPLTSPAAAGSGSTGHGLPPAEAILRFGEHLRHDLEGVDRDPGAIGASLIATSALRWLRAALAASDADVAEALGIHPCGHIAIQRDCGGCDPGAVEFVRDDGGDWRKA